MVPSGRRNAAVFGPSSAARGLHRPHGRSACSTAPMSLGPTGSRDSTAFSTSVRLVCPAPTTRKVPSAARAHVSAPRERVGAGPCTITTSASAESAERIASASLTLRPGGRVRGRASTSGGPRAQRETVEGDSRARDRLQPPYERRATLPSIHLQVPRDAVALEVGDRDAVPVEGQRETEVDNDLAAAVPSVGADDARLRGVTEPAASATRATSRRYDANSAARTADAGENDSARKLPSRVPSTGRPLVFARSSFPLTLGVRASATRTNARPANSPAKAPNSSSSAGRGRIRIADVAGSTTSSRGSDARGPAAEGAGWVDAYRRSPAATAFASAIASDPFRVSTSIVTIRVSASDSPRTLSRSSAREMSCFASRSAYVSTGVLFTSSAYVGESPAGCPTKTLARAS